MEDKNDLNMEGQELPEEKPVGIPEDSADTQEKTENSMDGEPAVPQEDTYTDNTRKDSPFADSPYVMQHPEKTEKEKKSHKHCAAIKNWTAVLAITLAAAVVSSGITSFMVGAGCRKQLKLMNQALDEKIAAMEAARPSAPNQPAKPQSHGDHLTPGQIYDAHAGAVVSVICSLTETNSAGQEMIGESSGSGFIVSSDGYVVTNCHVIEGADSVKVRDHDANEYEAEIVGKDAGNDVALLKIEGTDLQTVEIGNCDDLFVGDQVVVIGHPLGNQEAILTVGYVSSKNQVVRTDGNSSSQDMIQTDAAINAGNSGGPLFDSMGRVIGITTAKYSGYSSSGASIEGVGYAIPMDDVVAILPELKEFGKVKHSYLGVVVRDVDAHAQEYGIPAGAFLQEVTDGLAADQAGMQEKDVIVELGGYEVKSVPDLTRVLRKFRTGEEVTAKIWRNGEYQYVSVVLGEKPEEVPEPTQPKPQAPAEMPEMPDDWFQFFDHFFGN